MSAFYESPKGFVTCPRCGLRFSPKRKRKKAAVIDGRWRVAYVGRGVLMVGRLGFHGWLGTWEKVIGQGRSIVPPFDAIGYCSMEIRGVLRKNGLYCRDLETGRYRRAGKTDVVARTDAGRRRLRAFGWPGDLQRPA